jgi:major membrane immunogen (membrane-anchored lipoprotein)
MKKWAAVLITGIAALSFFTGCGSGEQKNSAPGSAKKPSSSYKDGAYTAKSSPDERGAVGEITLVIEQGKITKADYKGIMKDGKIKDAEYGKTNGKIENQDFYKKAQNAVKATAVYPVRLVETQSADIVDAISGATISYNQFKEAVKLALKKAK